MTRETFTKAVMSVLPEKLWLACIGQAIAESGIADTKLAQGHNNFHGMKWRKDDDFKNCMAGINCKGFLYYTDSEPTGSAEFIEFATVEDGVKGWLAFLNRAPYVGKLLSSSEDLINTIGAIWCPPGQLENYKNSHGGRNYQQQIIQVHFETAKKLIEQYKGATPPSDFSDVTWHNAFILIDEKTRQMEIGLASYAADKLRCLGRISTDSSMLTAYLSKFPNAKNVVKAEPTKTWPSDVPTDPIKPPPVTGKRVLLDIGHSLKNGGASSIDGSVKEYVVNKYAVEAMQKVLQDNGISADIYDPDPDNLTAVGQRAWQYDACISFHHNSYNGSGNPYHCIMIDPSAPASWKEYTSKMCVAMASALDGSVADTVIMKGGTNGLDGVYEAELSVLNASAKDPDGKPPYHCLVEAYFLNKMNNVTACLEASKKAGEAIAKFMAANPWPSSLPAPGPTPTGVVIYKKGENIQLSKDFHLEEFECKCSRCTETKVDMGHVANMQKLRDIAGKICNTSGYRCPEHNAEVGGVSDSQHTGGFATDCYSETLSTAELAKIADTIFDGVGTYIELGFVHVDSRGYKARWNG